MKVFQPICRIPTIKIQLVQFIETHWIDIGQKAIENISQTDIDVYLIYSRILILNRSNLFFLYRTLKCISKLS